MNQYVKYLIMKNTIKLSLTVILLIFTFTYCTNDSLEVVTKNEITLDGEAFLIDKASIMAESVGEEGHSAIVLTSGNTSLTIDIPVFTKDKLTGTYSYPKINQHRLLNHETTNYKNSSNVERLEKGTVVIMHEGRNYFSVKVDITMQNGKVFKGTYVDWFELSFDSK